MAIVRWQPFSDLLTLRHAMDRLFVDNFVSLTGLTRVFGDGAGVPIDMYGTDESIVVKATVPGVKPEEIDITISGDILTIKGKTRTEEEVKEESYFRREIGCGAFRRSMPLPDSLWTDKAEATFENGVVTLTIPKAGETKPRQIKITPKEATEGRK